MAKIYGDDWRDAPREKSFEKILRLSMKNQVKHKMPFTSFYQKYHQPDK